MKVGSLLLFAAVLLPLPAQERPLEELREIARVKVEEMRSEFDRDMTDALRTLSESDPSRDTSAAAEARRRVAAWAPGFPSECVAILKKTTNDWAKHHLAVALSNSRAKSLAPRLLELLPTADLKMSVQIVNIVGQLGDPSAIPGIILALSSPTAEAPAFHAAALSALANLKAPETTALARKSLQHLSPEVRSASARCLAEVTKEPKEDVPLLIKLFQEERVESVRADLLRALGRFPNRDDVLRILHDTVAGKEAPLASAALDALEMKDVASKESSPKYLYDAVVGELPTILKERAARLMAERFSDARGAKVIAKPFRDAAEKSPKDVNVQMGAGDALRRLGAYDEALGYYRKAEPLYSSSSRYEARVAMARCFALLGKFEEAKKRLSDYKSLRVFADDPDFQGMKADPKYKTLFE